MCVRPTVDEEKHAQDFSKHDASGSQVKKLRKEYDGSLLAFASHKQDNYIVIYHVEIDLHYLYI